MSWVGIIDLVLNLLDAALTGLGANDKYRKVSTEVQAAINALARARTEAMTNAETSALLIKPEW